MTSTNLVKRMIDIGANLTDPMFRGIYRSTQKHPDDFINMMSRAKKQGVEKMIVTGTSLHDSKEALMIARNYDDLYCTVGCHPTQCGEFEKSSMNPSEYLRELEELAKENRDKVVAIGELGLDYDRLHFCSKDTQKAYFEKQLAIAEHTNLPLFLHNRNSSDDLIEILNRNREKFASAGGVVHSFDGSASDLDKFLELGLYIGINGCSLKTEQNLEVAKLIPTDRLMIETDCPWCEIKKSHSSYSHVETEFKRCKDASVPEFPVKGRNEPAMLTQVLEVLANIRQEKIDYLSEEIYKNTNKLFFSN